MGGKFGKYPNEYHAGVDPGQGHAGVTTDGGAGMTNDGGAGMTNDGGAGVFRQTKPEGNMFVMPAWVKPASNRSIDTIVDPGQGHAGVKCL
jgi:hypothetical protein